MVWLRSMIKWVFLLVLVNVAYAQTTNVSLVGITDSDSTLWANGTWKIDFNPNFNNPGEGQYTQNGVHLSGAVTHQIGVLDNSGSASIIVYDSSTITPTGSGWKLTVCPKASSQCGIYTFFTAGSAQNITTGVNSSIPAVRFPAVSGSYGYADIEAITQNIPGSTYYNTNLQCNRVYNGTTWACGSGSAGSGNVGAGSAKQVAVYPSSGTSVSGSSFINVNTNLEQNVTAAPYNADPTGVLDSTAAFNAAIAALGTGVGGVFVPQGDYKISGVIDLNGPLGSSFRGRTLRGSGMGTHIICQPSSHIAACIRTYKGLNTISDFYLSGDANADVALDIDIDGGSAEDTTISNVLIDGLSPIGIGIGLYTTLDIAHVNLYSVKVLGATTAGMQVGNGLQANVLDNNCYGCTFDLNTKGVVLAGGGMGLYGVMFDDNTGTDIYVQFPADQPLVVEGARSENSAQFFRNGTANSNTLMPSTFINCSWINVANASPATYTFDSGSTGAPVTIINSRFGSTTNTVQFNFSGTGGGTVAPVIFMQNVGTNNPAFETLLDFWASNNSNGGSFYSAGDFQFDPNTDAQTKGSGLIYSSASPVYYGKNLSTTKAGAIAAASNIKSATALQSPAGVDGNFQNLITYSEFDAANPNWSTGFCNTPNPPTITPNTTDTTGPHGETTVEKVVTQGVLAIGCGGSINSQFQNFTFTPGVPYAEAIWMKGAVGGETGAIYIGTPGVAGASVATAFVLTTQWQQIPVLGTLAGTHVSPFGFVILFNSTSATYYLNLAQLEGNVGAVGNYAQTHSTPISLTIGSYKTTYYDKSLPSAPAIGTDSTGKHILAYSIPNSMLLNPSMTINGTLCTLGGSCTPGGGGGSMTWPAGGAGIPNYSGASSWGTSYSASNLIPASFISLLNQNTSGTAANLSGTPTVPNGTAATTQAAADNSTKLATTAYADRAAGLGVTGGTLVITGGTQGANSCTVNATITDTGLTASGAYSRVISSYTSDPAALTGWGSTGGMVLQIWATSANTATYHICNQTASSITYSSITFGLGAN